MEYPLKERIGKPELFTGREKELAQAAVKIIFDAGIEELGDLTASAIARRLGVSFPNLSRAVRKHFKVTLVYFLRENKYCIFELLMRENKNLTTKNALEILAIRCHSNSCRGFKHFL